MKITPVETGLILTNGYFISDETTGKAVVVDAPLDSAELYMELLTESKCELEAIFLTHSHWDHTADAAKVKRETGASIYIHQSDEYRLLNPMDYTLLTLDFEIETAKADVYFTEKQKLTFGNLSFEVIHTPGHTEGGVCLIMPENRIVFTGDTLFNGSIGRTDLPGGDYDTILISLMNRIMILPDDFTILSGHGPKTDIGSERTSNPFIINNLKL